MRSTDKHDQLWQPCAAAEPLTFTVTTLDGEQRYAALAWGVADSADATAAEPQNPLLVAFHGWLDNALSFAPLAEHLLAHYCVIAIDWPGHGLSDWRPGSYPLQWADYLLDMERLLSAISQQFGDIEAVLAHSLGGMVAGTYAALNSERIKRLILIESFAPLHAAANVVRERLQKSLQQHRKRPPKARHYVALGKLARQRQQLTGLEREWCELLLSRNLGCDAQGQYWRVDPRLRWTSPVRMTFEQVDALMMPVLVPTLLLYGANGYDMVQQQLPHAKRWYQQLTLQCLSGHHHLHMSHSAAVATAIISYLSTTKV